MTPENRKLQAQLKELKQAAKKRPAAVDAGEGQEEAVTVASSKGAGGSSKKSGKGGKEEGEMLPPPDPDIVEDSRCVGHGWMGGWMNLVLSAFRVVWGGIISIEHPLPVPSAPSPPLCFQQRPAGEALHPLHAQEAAGGRLGEGHAVSTSIVSAFSKPCMSLDLVAGSTWMHRGARSKACLLPFLVFTPVYGAIVWINMYTRESIGLCLRA